jgi:hypothetical protein
VQGSVVRRCACLAVTSILALAWAGCGGSDDSSSTSTSSTAAASQPAAQFVSQADEICTAENKKRAEGGPPPQFDPANATPKQLADAADYLQNDLEASTDEFNQLEQLAPPEGLETEWATLVDDFETTILPAFQDGVAAAQDGDTAAFADAFGGIADADKETTQLASKIGFKVCGK